MTAFEQTSGRDDSDTDAGGPSRRPDGTKAGQVFAQSTIDANERRDNPRLRLSYPIAVGIRTTEGVEDLERCTTENLSARGAFFCTENGSAFHIGLPVRLTVSVPHRIATDGREVLLALQGDGQVIRTENALDCHFYGEDGFPVTGVAIEFFSPLRFDADWF